MKLSQRVNLFLLLTWWGGKGNHKVLNENIPSCVSFIGGTTTVAALWALVTKVMTTVFPEAPRSKAPSRSQPVLRRGPCKPVQMLFWVKTVHSYKSPYWPFSNRKIESSRSRMYNAAQMIVINYSYIRPHLLKPRIEFTVSLCGNDQVCYVHNSCPEFTRALWHYFFSFSVAVK